MPPHAKSWLIGKDSDAGRDWRQEEKETTEDEMAGWHHWLDAHESEWTPWVGDRQGGLACYDSWGRKESDTTEQLNWTDKWNITLKSCKSLYFIHVTYNVVHLYFNLKKLYILVTTQRVLIKQNILISNWLKLMILMTTHGLITFHWQNLKEMFYLWVF